MRSAQTRAPASLLEELRDKIVAADSEVRRYRSECAGERTDAECSMSRDRHVVLPVHLRRQAHVAAGLTRLNVAQTSKRSRETVARQIPRQGHTAMSSS